MGWNSINEIPRIGRLDFKYYLKQYTEEVKYTKCEKMAPGVGIIWIHFPQKSPLSIYPNAAFIFINEDRWNGEKACWKQWGF